MRFTTTLLLTVAGVDREFEAEVEGDYSPAYHPGIPRGEYAQIDPDEPEDFSLSSITIDWGAEGKPRILDLTPMISDEQEDELRRLGIEAAAAERDENEYRMLEARQEAREAWSDMRDERDDL